MNRCKSTVSQRVSDEAVQDLAPGAIQSRLTTQRYGRSLRVVSCTGSTNEDAQNDVKAGVPDGHVVVADCQRAGRGSHGRSWSSPPGTDLYVSVVDRPQVAPALLPPLTLAVGLAVAETVEALVDKPDCTRVKWPNDVWLHGRKCAGILVETAHTGSLLEPVVIGIGLNVNRRKWPAELRATAISMASARGPGQRLDRALALCELLAHVEKWVDGFVRRGAGFVVEALQNKLALKGETVTCDGVHGRLVGVSESGAVCIETEDGKRELLAGTLSACA